MKARERCWAFRGAASRISDPLLGPRESRSERIGPGTVGLASSTLGHGIADPFLKAIEIPVCLVVDDSAQDGIQAVQGVQEVKEELPVLASLAFSGLDHVPEDRAIGA